MWYTGIDWAGDHHDTVVIDEAGRQPASLRVTHTREGLNQLTSFLLGITRPDAKEQMACIIETTHGLLIAALLEAGFAVYPVNPKTVDRRRKPAGAKTGRSDLPDLPTRCATSLWKS
jgi:hypothetical protein